MGVELSEEILKEVNHCHSRLISERNLRFNMESTKVPKSDNDNVKELTNLIEEANTHAVEGIYIT